MTEPAPYDDRPAAASPLTVREHLEDELRAGGGPALAQDETVIEQVAVAVDTYLRQAGPATPALDARQLVVLASRALSSLGHGLAARRMLVMGSGLVRPATSTITGAGPLWTLDLEQMTVRDGQPTELLFYQVLQAILEAVADVWDATQGEGALALRHVSTTAAALRGGRDGRDRALLRREIKRWTGGKLMAIGVRRGWRTAPRVIDLDGVKT